MKEQEYPDPRSYAPDYVESIFEAKMRLAEELRMSRREAAHLLSISAELLTALEHASRFIPEAVRSAVPGSTKALPYDMVRDAVFRARAHPGIDRQSMREELRMSARRARKYNLE